MESPAPGARTKLVASAVLTVLAAAFGVLALIAFGAVGPIRFTVRDLLGVLSVAAALVLAAAAVRVWRS